MLFRSSRPERSLNRVELLELRAQLANFEAPARHPEPVTDSEDSEDEHEGQLQCHRLHDRRVGVTGRG